MVWYSRHCVFLKKTASICDKKTQIFQSDGFGKIFSSSGLEIPWAVRLKNRVFFCRLCLQNIVSRIFVYRCKFTILCVRKNKIAIKKIYCCIVPNSWLKLWSQEPFESDSPLTLPNPTTTLKIIDFVYRLWLTKQKKNHLSTPAWPKSCFVSAST